MKNIAILCGLAWLSWLAPANAEGLFVQSNTDAVILGNGEDSVVTSVQLGYESEGLSAAVGPGYASLNDEAVITAEISYDSYLTENLTMELEVEAYYGLNSDELSLKPEVGLRYYF